MLEAQTDISGQKSKNIIPAFKIIDNQLVQVQQLVSDFICVDVPGEIREVVLRMRDVISGGKMLRPGLVLLAGEAVGKITDRHIHIAAIIEMIHNATLLHDDVIDEGSRRRGAPTMNSLMGNESAVLLGDFLLSRVFRLCTEIEPKISRMITAAAARTCEGELRQVVQRRRRQLSESEYIGIITEKSAALFGCCCEAGAALSGAGEAQIQSFGRFGRNVGVAFQITDDLLDIIGDEGKMGKTLGRDSDKNKLTLAVIHLLRTAGEKERAAVSAVLGQQGRGKKVPVEILKRSGSLQYTQEKAQEYVEKAIASLTGLKESSAKRSLIEIARFAAERKV